MKVYKVTFKDKKDKSYWDNCPIAIVASNFSNAEDKAKNFDDREILGIEVIGETTSKTDVYELKR